MLMTPQNIPQCAKLRLSSLPVFIKLLPHSSTKKHQQEPLNIGAPCSFNTQSIATVLFWVIKAWCFFSTATFRWVNFNDAAMFACRGRDAAQPRISLKWQWPSVWAHLHGSKQSFGIVTDVLDMSADCHRALSLPKCSSCCWCFFP